MQANMPVAGVAAAWPQTGPVLEGYGLSPSDPRTLAEAVGDPVRLREILAALNAAVGSSDATCVEGG
ncbi:MAG: hypothetical protein H5T97_02520 [Firmicutes bacterium]|nr:hypothetical protein [Bacillota bacterium]